MQSLSTLTNWIADPAISAILAAILALVGKEYFDSRRERREAYNFRLVNLYDYYFKEYLSQDIKELRSQVAGSKGDEVSHYDSPAENTLSNALQKIGVMSYLGVIPLYYAFIMNGPQIVSDWVLVFDHVNYRVRRFGNKEEVLSRIKEIPYARRHGEWLALISYQWLRSQKFTPDDHFSKVVRDFEELYGGEANILLREKILFEHERQVVSGATRRWVKKTRKEYKSRQRTGDLLSSHAGHAKD